MTAPRRSLDLSPYTLSYPEAPLEWTAVFGDDRPVELEVGSGKGLFLATASRARPLHGFVGVEIVSKYARRAADRVAKLGLENVRVVNGDARRLLGQFVPPSSLEAVHIYFPDPWWKQKHRKRRVFCEEFVCDVARALRPGRRFWIATDVEDYFKLMRAILSRHPEFGEEAFPEVRDPEHELDYLTNFERKYRLEGRPIFRQVYHLRESAGEIQPRGASSA